MGYSQMSTDSGAKFLASACVFHCSVCTLHGGDFRSEISGYLCGMIQPYAFSFVPVAAASSGPAAWQLWLPSCFTVAIRSMYCPKIVGSSDGIEGLLGLRVLCLRQAHLLVQGCE